ncbi:hypothetical protein MMC24_000142 [Lignoscripta atroalba]|nr:hypothetical protein [Lignoscripta atroalba]
MASTDPSTSQPLPADAIQRVLYIANSIHVYSIPPLTSTKGYTASQWTADNNKREIFTARIRILETAIPNADGLGETVKTDVLLEDPNSGQLFAAAPYTDASAVEQVLDSSRFFAIRVVGEGGRKAMLGIGFEERSEAFDFGIALQEVRKVQGIDKETVPPGKRKPAGQAALAEKVPEKKDFSLKEGQTIHIDLGRATPKHRDGGFGGAASAKKSAWIAPPSGGKPNDEPMSFLPPPPSAQDVKAENRRSKPPESLTAADLGFDDGEFGEFQ